MVGRYKLTQELEDRTLDFEQTVTFTSDEENFYLVFRRWVMVDGELFKEKDLGRDHSPGLSVSALGNVGSARSQRADRIESSGAPSGNEGGDERHDDEHARDHRETSPRRWAQPGREDSS